MCASYYIHCCPFCIFSHFSSLTDRIMAIDRRLFVFVLGFLSVCSASVLPKRIATVAGSYTFQGTPPNLPAFNSYFVGGQDSYDISTGQTYGGSFRAFNIEYSPSTATVTSKGYLVHTDGTYNNEATIINLDFSSSTFSQSGSGINITGGFTVGPNSYVIKYVSAGTTNGNIITGSSALSATEFMTISTVLPTPSTGVEVVINMNAVSKGVWTAVTSLFPKRRRRFVQTPTPAPTPQPTATASAAPSSSFSFDHYFVGGQDVYEAPSGNSPQSTFRAFHLVLDSETNVFKSTGYIVSAQGVPSSEITTSNVDLSTGTYTSQQGTKNVTGGFEIVGDALHLTRHSVRSDGSFTYGVMEIGPRGFDSVSTYTSPRAPSQPLQIIIKMWPCSKAVFSAISEFISTEMTGPPMSQ